MQVLNTFCVLIDFNNSIDILGSRLCYWSHFVAIFSSFSGQVPHYLQSDSNMMNPSRIRRCMIEPEEIWSKNPEKKENSVEILQGCEISQPTNFRRL